MSSIPLAASHEGRFTLGKWQLHAFNLTNGMRVFDQESLTEVLGISPGARSSAALAALAGHPVMKNHPLSSNGSFLNNSVSFKALNGKWIQGFEANGLIELCKFLLKAREMGLLRSSEHLRYAQAAESLLISLAHVGLTALIDEATGFQKARSADALQVMLDKYLKKELAAWTKRFPNDFYQQLYRLKEWEWQGMGINRPQIVGRYTNDIVYQRLAPGILDELERRNPDRLHRHHQWLSDDIGHPALAQHLYAVIALMKVSKTWKQFWAHLQEAFPLKGDQLYLGLDED